VRLGANAALSKSPTHDYVAGDSGPNELQHAALFGTAPTLKPEGLQGWHCSNPVSTRRRLTQAVPLRRDQAADGWTVGDADGRSMPAT